MAIIKSEMLTVEINNHGAELRSVKNNDGTEFMWQRTPGKWDRCAPIMFPICGSLNNDTYIYKDKEYKLPLHGFASDMDFEMELEKENEITFLLKANDETRKCYPFEFEFRVNYLIEGNTLKVTYSAKNVNSDEMYFAFGGHEGYATPEGIEEYKVVFDNKLTLSSYDMSGTIVQENKKDLAVDSDTIYFTDEDFCKNRIGAMVFPRIDAKECSLIHKNGTRKVTVKFDEFKHLLLWEHLDRGFLCIEPWTSLTDIPGEVGRIDEKPDMRRLCKGEEFSASHYITFDI